METVTEDIAVEAMQHTDAAEAGLALRCFGLNLLCRKVIPLADSIASVLEMRVIQANGDYAIIAGPQLAKLLIIQLHADATYHANPLPSLLPEPGAGRGRGTPRRCGILAVRNGPGCGRSPSRGGGMAHSATADRQATRVARVLPAGCSRLLLGTRQGDRLRADAGG